MVKSHENKMPTLFSYHYDHYDVIKCLRILHFEKKDSAPYAVKNDRVWLLWGEKYLSSTSNKILLRQC